VPPLDGRDHGVVDGGPSGEGGVELGEVSVQRPGRVHLQQPRRPGALLGNGVRRPARDEGEVPGSSTRCSPSTVTSSRPARMYHR
jgi:hypothetical protein